MDEEMKGFLAYLSGWESNLPRYHFGTGGVDVARTALLSVDLVNGFCTEGPLASSRVKNIIAPVVRLFEQAWSAGVGHYALLQDSHEDSALEFSAFPPHCRAGTSQADTVPEIRVLPFFQVMAVIRKNTIHSGLNTGLDAWLSQRPEVDTMIIVGDCTDLCVYQLAMHLKLRANAYHHPVRVIVPADCVDTYDIPVDMAARIGAMPHPAELLHTFFLYHMALNGIEVTAGFSSAEGEI
jgi:nicotinamidase-related amidase